jgi:hypothetical protein
MFVTICRLYETYPDAVEAVKALQADGVPTKDISIVANNSDNWFGAGGGDATNAEPGGAKPADAQPDGPMAFGGRPEQDKARSSRFEGSVIGATIGAAAGTAGTLIGSLITLAIPGVGAAVGAGWLLGLIVTGAAVGGATGGLLGALTTAGVSEADAQVYAEGVRRGGSLVTARVQPADTRHAEAAMERGAVDTQKRGDEYRQSGWQFFNAVAEPYTAAQVRRERDFHQAA